MLLRIFNTESKSSHSRVALGFRSAMKISNESGVDHYALAVRVLVTVVAICGHHVRSPFHFLPLILRPKEILEPVVVLYIESLCLLLDLLIKALLSGRRARC